MMNLSVRLSSGYTTYEIVFLSIILRMMYHIHLLLLFYIINVVSLHVLQENKQ